MPASNPTPEPPNEDKRAAFDAAVRSALVEYGKASILSVFTLNGSAVVAIMAFVGAFAKRPEIIRAVAGEAGFFLAGVVMAALAWFATYLSFFAHDARWNARVYQVATAAAWLLPAFSLVAFVCGCWRSHNAVLPLL